MLNKIAVLVLSAILFSGSAFAQFRPSPDGLKFERTLQLINGLYVDDTDTGALTEAAIRAMLSELDPHSTYLNEEEVKAMNEPLQGNFDGIGISFNMLTDTLYVMEVIAGGPSQKVGIMPGDRIIYVDNKLIAGVDINNQDVIKMLRGPKGTTVNVKILRRGAPDLIEFRIIRDKIPITSIDASYMITSDVGYIRLSRFGMTSGTEFREAEESLRKQGMKHLLLDLTDNGGGILQTANEIVDEFLGDGKVIVYTEGNNQPRFTMNATGDDELDGGKLVVLINGASASASEILAGAVQDWDRGVIVGRRSFGKGLVQRQLPLPDGTMIRLTVARYYTPSGRSIQKPYEGGEVDAYNQDFINRYNSGELFEADSIHLPDSLKFQTLVNKRTVFGGGGIMPDYFVPWDTTMISPYINRIFGTDSHREFILGYLENNKKNFDNMSFEQYYENFEVSDTMLQDLIKIAEKNKVPFDEKDYGKSKEYLKTLIKAHMGRSLYDDNAFYKVINDINEVYQQAIKLFDEAEKLAFHSEEGREQ